jgi:D-xylose transport system substrate-binding protein
VGAYNNERAGPAGVELVEGFVHFMKRSRLGVLSLVLSAGLVGAVCTGGASASITAAQGPSGISVSSFTGNFSEMSQFHALAAAGKGKVAAILPDVVSSNRYVEFDQPDLSKAFELAGLKPSQYTVQNARGSDTIEFDDAQTDIASGATVLVMDPLDSGVGARIESYARSHRVKVIDYDRLTLGGSRLYYVSFNNLEVGKIMGQGLVSCVAAWHVAKPQVVVMDGPGPGDTAPLLAQGYNAVVQRYFSSGKWVDVLNTAAPSGPSTAEAEFQSAYTAHPGINAALVPNDEDSAPIITYLQARQVKPHTFPITGQGASLTGLQNVLSGYQCGTVYEPIYVEAQAAVSLALYLRARQVPPRSLVNGTTEDTGADVSVPSVLLNGEWVTPRNMNDTVIRDKFVPASQLCAGPFARACTAAGIRR